MNRDEIEQSDATATPRWPGAILVGALIAALIWANLAPHAYEQVLTSKLGTLGGLPHGGTVEAWINDFVMAIFFLAVGLEVGHERRHGALSDGRSALAPVLAALGGMVVAALSYLLVSASWHATGVVFSGWGIPMATDIAFALGCLQLLGASVPAALRIFVLALAVADDVFSVIALGVSSASTLSLLWAGVALGVVLAVIVARRFVTSRSPYVLATVLLWFAMANAGVEPILAGAIVGVLVPTTGDDVGHSTSTRLLRPTTFLSSAVVLPLFVIANAGVDLSPSVLHNTEAASVFVALLIARTAGKVVGIAGTVYVLRSVGLMRFGPGLTMAKIIGASLLCGVGFTVPLLYASVAFAHHEELFASTQLGLLVASALGVIGGLLVLSRAARRRVPLSDGE